MSFPTSPQCHSRSPPSVIPDITPSVIPGLTPSVIPGLTPSVIPGLTPSVIPDVCNRESSQLKRRNSGFPLTTGGNDRRRPAGLTEGPQQE